MNKSVKVDSSVGVIVVVFLFVLLLICDISNPAVIHILYKFKCNIKQQLICVTIFKRKIISFACPWFQNNTIFYKT